MMKLFQVLLITFGLLTTSIHAMTLEEYQARKDERNIKFYIAGVGGGYYYSNNYLDTIGRLKLYCQPSSVNISGEMYPAILETYASNLGKQVKGVSVEIILLKALVELYPCH